MCAHFLQFFSIGLAHFLKQKLHSQNSKIIWQNSLTVQHNTIAHLQKLISLPKLFTHASKLNSFPIKIVSATKMQRSFSIALAHFLKQTGRSQHSWCFCQNNLDGSAQHHGSPAKAHISPKTVHSCVKTKFLSHINSQCPQNASSLWHCVSTASQNV